MRQNYVIILITSLGLFLSACSSMLEEPASFESGSIDVEYSSSKINKEEAIHIANKILKKFDTRNDTPSTPSCEYIVNSHSTRSSSTPDTVAYVLNYPDNEGFAIISSSRKVHPVLAFSTIGKFDFDNEAVNLYFIDKIASYIDNADDATIHEDEEELLAGCVVIDNYSPVNINQYYPWNKYVVQDFPNCPAGCVAVATALCMGQTQDSLYYHKKMYYPKTIIENINNYSDSQSPIAKNKYLTAVDDMAKIIYWIGFDIDMIYKPEVSVALSSKAYDLCKRLGFKLPSGYADYNADENTLYDMAGYLYNDGIIYVHGDIPDAKNKAHAWVFDGCMYCYKDKITKKGIQNVYFRCNWGWGGKNNGFYRADVFDSKNQIDNTDSDFTNTDYKVLNYFAVMQQSKYSIPILP